MPRDVHAFILSLEWRDTARGLELTIWGRSKDDGPVCATFRGQEAVFFVPRHAETRSGRRVQRALKTLQGTPVDAVYFPTQRALIEERSRIRQSGGVTYEADLKPSNRFGMERFFRGGVHLRGEATKKDGVTRLLDPQVHAFDVTPQLSSLSIDIETDGWDGPVLSVALAAKDFEQTFLPKENDEAQLLREVFTAIRTIDPDTLIGWNVVDFDLRVLQTRAELHHVPFAIGRANELARILVGDSAQSVTIARVPGRVALDGVATLRNASWAFERYTLEFVAQSLLGRGKKIDHTLSAISEIRRMAREDPPALAAYNLEDARLARDIFEKGRLIEFLIARAKLTGLLLDRVGGSVAAFDYLYLPRLHRRGYVAPDVGTLNPQASPGGHVLESVPGLMRNVASFDFRSLYPSIIRTFQIDPLGLWVTGEDPVEGFEGARFARSGGILPELINTLHEARTAARETGDDTLSTAVKILMNSFYGVLGTPGSRFFDPRLASSVTRRGHEIIERSRVFFEQRGYPVIYGDTDSLFVRLPESLDEADARLLGQRLAGEVNDFWKRTIETEHRLASFLELRFDTMFLRFLMPTLRGEESKGSKKRYAGLIHGKGGVDQLIIRGLEAVRTDWTPLARETQRELFMRVFTDAPWEAWLLELRTRVLSGALDEKLIYRKRLRRDVDQYQSDAPHVKAARQKLEEGDDDTPMNDVEYVMTVKGAQPIGSNTAPLDYGHYLEKQLAPAVDVVLTLLGTSWARVAGEQLELFEAPPRVTD